MSCPCRKDIGLPRCLQGTLEPQHYLTFPKTIEGCKHDVECKRLRHYVTCPSVLSPLFKETRAHIKNVLKTSKLELSPTGIILLEGGRDEQWSYYQSDCSQCVFKQEQFFRHMFGVNIPDAHGIYNLADGKFHAFVPATPEEHRQYVGDALPLDDIKFEYGLDSVHWNEELEQFVRKINPSVVYILDGINDDSGLRTKNIANLSKLNLKDYESKVNSTYLYDLLALARVNKTPKELDMLRVCAYISSMAHCITMRQTEPGTEEIMSEGIFKAVCTIVGGARNVAYTCICGSGINGSILHYGHATRPNDRINRSGDIVLHDMGGIFPNGYLSDITVSYPVDKKFTPDQKAVYQAVYDANMAVFHAAKPGIEWVDMHKLSEEKILEGLVKLGILKGDIKEMMEKRMSAYFMPHGLGHLVGLDVHDCGSHNPVMKDTLKDKAGLRNLRCTKTLEENMFITIEPGCYFISYLIDELKGHKDLSKYLNADVVDRFMDFGGVRIEDDVVITANGVENYTVVPRTVEEIEAFFQS